MSVEIRILKELRATTDGDNMRLEGYASTFNQESNDLGGFREKVAPGAFTRSLADKTRDVKATFNHKPDYILGRLKNQTLEVHTDDKGLYFRCLLNPKSQAHRDIHAQVERGDIDECSFAFTADKPGQSWNVVDDAQGGSYILRTLTNVDLFDVSVVSEPAYPGTSVDARSAVMITPEIRSQLDELAAAKALAQKPNTETRSDEQSYEDFLGCLNDALNEKFPCTDEQKGIGYGCGQFWICETYEQSIVVQECGKSDCYFRIPYVCAEDGSGCTFGEPTPVEQVWVASERAAKRIVEARGHLDRLAAEHKDNAGYHAQASAAHADAAEAERIAGEAVAAEAARAAKCSDAAGNCEDADCRCQNCMRSQHECWDADWEDEDGDDENERSAKKAKRETREAAITVEQRAEKTRTKTVDGKSLTADKFAYVGDPEKTETWKLPIHDKSHAQNALARFNQTEGIADDKKAGVLRKIKSAAKKFGIDVSERSLVAGGIEAAAATTLVAQLRALPYDADELADIARRAKAAIL